MNRRGQDRTGPLGGSGMVGLWGAPSLIKSIQRGVITSATAGSATATIAAVDMAHSRLRVTGWKNTATTASAENYWLTKAVLTNSTTVTMTVNTAGVSSWSLSWEVIEYRPGVIKSMQRGTFDYSTMSSGNLGVLTITAVEMAKTEIDILDKTSNYPAATCRPDFSFQTALLASATTVEFKSYSDPNGSGGTWTNSYEITEWY